MSRIKDHVVRILTEDPSLTNEQVADIIQETVPGATTSAASVASIKSGARKQGLLSTTNVSRNSEPTVAPVLPDETSEEREERINRRFATLERMAHRVSEGEIPALIVSGPPGLGKSFTIEKVLRDEGIEHDIICGSIAPPGLLIALWEMKDGGVVVLDDCDDVFRDETCLNILKAVLDSSDVREVSYRKEAHWMKEYDIPRKFEFNGTVVFCTNIDFEMAIAKGSSMATHFEALIDRSLYLSLTMRTKEDFMTRIRQVSIDEGMLVKAGLTEDQALEVMSFVDENRDRFYGLSLRLMHQIASCYKADPDCWKDDVEATKMRTI